jgi:hypothetical protein
MIRPGLKLSTALCHALMGERNLLSAPLPSMLPISNLKRLKLCVGTQQVISEKKQEQKIVEIITRTFT